MLGSVRRDDRSGLGLGDVPILRRFFGEPNERRGADPLRPVEFLREALTLDERSVGTASLSNVSVGGEISFARSTATKF
jgi:hypothetical protein